MSDSRKKNGIVKYGRSYKGRSYNRKFRCRNKQAIRMGKDPYQMKELVNQYDVYDVRSRFDEERFRNARYPFTEEEIGIWKRKYFQK